MKNLKTYDPYLSDCGLPAMAEDPMGSYVHYFDYNQLYKKYIQARSALSKAKMKATLKNKHTI